MIQVDNEDMDGNHIVYGVFEITTGWDGLNPQLVSHDVYTDYFDAQHKLSEVKKKVKGKCFTMGMELRDDHYEAG